MPISAFIITLNEERRIGQALDSLKWTDEQIVVDGGSEDHTVEICRQKGARIFERAFDNFESQKNYALSLTRYDWVLSIDADEIVSPALAGEIQSAIMGPGSLDGFRIKRRNYFLNKPLRFAGQGSEPVLRLFRKTKSRFSGIVHERVTIDGSVGNLVNGLEHKSTATLAEYYQKLNSYTDLDGSRLVFEKRVPSLLKSILSPLAKWFLNYLLRGGFLDGRHGFLYHALSCYYGWVRNFKARALIWRTEK